MISTSRRRKALLSSSWLAIAVTALPGVAAAQSVVPEGYNAPIIATSIAPDQPSQTTAGANGSDAAAGADYVVKIQTPNVVKDGNVAALIDIQSLGGRGGDSGQSNADLNHDGPLGGAGGGGGALTLTLDAPTGTPGNSSYSVFEAYAAKGYGARLISTGGTAGDGGQNGNSSGNGGVGGSGATGGALVYTMGANAALDQVYSFIEGQGAGVLLQSTGGNGGISGYGGGSLISSVVGRKGGAGADGGQVTANIAGVISGYSWDPLGGGSGLVAVSTGGNGGTGGAVGNDQGKAIGGSGGNAGNGGGVNVYLTAGALTAQGPNAAATGTPQTYDANTTPGATVALDNSASAAAIFASSQGGNGGMAGTTDGLATTSGNGAVGGAGGAVTVSLNGKGIDANSNQIINTTGYNAFGVLAISAGGDGGEGNSGGGVFFRHGGSGGAGGQGGSAQIFVANDTSTSYAKIQTSGDDSDALVAINMGGGGGTSGDLLDSSGGGGAIFSLYMGGLGGSGGVAQLASISNGYFDPPPTDGSNAVFHPGDVIVTTGTYSRGLVAQSVGGGGGRGGDIINTSLTSAVTIGGKGGSGGSGGNAVAANFGLISTQGSYSAGIFSQSVGGGGGAGGGALSRVIGQQITVSFAMGGRGGSGGFAGDADAYNVGQVQTQGTNAHAMFVQSVGGGGGVGGSATAENYNDSVPDTPSIAVTTAVGGVGGSGNYGGDIEAVNSGLLQTQGQDAYGLFAQSIGGGGGAGGDAGVTNMAIQGAKFNFSLSLGGNGGTGGDGGKVNVWNSGLVSTDASTAIGIFAQSVGGGGGQGGHGTVDQGSFKSAGDYSAEITIAIGGQGGASGNGNDVVVNNYISSNSADPGYYNDFERFANRPIAGSGGILTQGDMAAGIMAQSVGGGGGVGGDSSGKGGNGQVNMNVAIGGGGGSGGSGGSVTVHNGTGAIQTYGAQSYGIFAQSVGGGGGAGGNAATGSGDDPEYDLGTQSANLATGNIAQNPTQFTKVTDKLWDWKDNLYGAWNDKDRLQELAGLNVNISDSKAPDYAGLKGSDLTIDVGGGAGGKGGTGGDGGTVLADNAGAITTRGGLAHGIFGQSIGGGGGVGGASAPVTGNDQLHDSAIEATMSLGGGAGTGGNGGTVRISNLAGGDIETTGDLAIGIFAESVGGGGGVAGASTPNSGFGNPMALTLGGAGDDTAVASGSGGLVIVTNAATIATTGDHGMGMLAQSIGGGGGVAAIMGTTLNSNTGLFESDTQAATQGTVAPTLAQNWLGKNNIGGSVTANLNSGGHITTAGVNAFGILAQSIGGSGGLMVIDKNTQVSVNSLATNPENLAPSSGNKAGMVRVYSENSTSIVTSGNGAAGIVAQSLGGGGVMLNGLNGVNLLQGSAQVYQDRWDMGMGGGVSVTNYSDITTTGAYAHGIFAQVASGTGGVIGRDGGGGTVFRSGLGETMYCGGTSIEAGGDCGGVATVTLQAGTITVSGANSWGAVLETENVSFQNIGGNDKMDWSIAQIDVGANARIFAKGSAAGAILLNGSGGNMVSNSGIIDGSASAGGYAINTIGRSYTVTNNAGGTIAGSFAAHCSGTCGDVGSISSSIDNKGTILAGDTIDLGTGKITNSGTFSVQGVSMGETTVTGNYAGSGTLVFDADFVAGKSDRLVVNGDAVVGDAIAVNFSSISNAPVKVISASGTLTLDPALKTVDASHLYDFKATAVGKDLIVAPIANFAAKAAGLGANEQAVAANLQSLFDGNASADAVFNRLLTVKDEAAYATSLRSLAGQGLGAFGAFRFNSSRTFAANLYGGCQDLQLESRKAGRCAWGRALVNNTDQAAGADTLGYTADAYALQQGLQMPVGDNLAVIGSIAYENARFRDGGGSARITGDSVVGGVGVLYTPARLELSAGIDAAYGWYKSHRTITLGLTEEANARPEQSQIGGHLRAAVNVLDSGKSFVRPFAEGHAIHVSNRAFTESGTSPFRLAVEGQSDTAFVGVAGMEIGTRVALSPTVSLRPFASAALEYGSPRSWTTTARFADQLQGKSFDLKTAGPGTLGRFSIGADLIGSKNVAFSVQYAPELGKDFTSHSGTARLTIAF